MIGLLECQQAGYPGSNASRTSCRTRCGSACHACRTGSSAACLACRSPVQLSEEAFHRVQFGGRRAAAPPGARPWPASPRPSGSPATPTTVVPPADRWPRPHGCTSSQSARLGPPPPRAAPTLVPYREVRALLAERTRTAVGTARPGLGLRGHATPSHQPRAKYHEPARFEEQCRSFGIHGGFVHIGAVSVSGTKSQASRKRACRLRARSPQSMTRSF